MSCSLWLEFPSVQPVVDELAAEVGNPSFVPHLSLVGTLPDDVDTVTSALRGALTGVAPATVPFRAFGTKHEEYRFFCLAAEPVDALMRVFDVVQTVVPGVADEHFRGWPHISLLYGTAAARKRWPEPMQIAARYGDRLFGQLPVRRVSVWDTSGPTGGWERVAEI